jgi:alpha-glucosidase (family GH31 glycosyl hydrolase)
LNESYPIEAIYLD